ncbi:hypothetical protein ACFQ10_09920 [Streptomyces indonesiensis]
MLFGARGRARAVRVQQRDDTHGAAVLVQQLAHVLCGPAVIAHARTSRKPDSTRLVSSRYRAGTDAT